MANIRDIRVKVNSKEYRLNYERRDGRGDFAGFGFGILDEKDKRVGYVRVIISHTTTAMWAHNTTFPYDGMEAAEKTATTALNTVLTGLEIDIDEEWFAQMSYRGDEITIQVNTMEDQVFEGGEIINFHGGKSPEEFVHTHLFKNGKNQKEIREQILKRIHVWEVDNFGLPFSTTDLAAELFLSRVDVKRAVDYLASSGFIEVKAAGDDELNVKLKPKGTDSVESYRDVTEIVTEEIDENKDEPIYNALLAINEDIANSYKQVLMDIDDGKRISWNGTASEMREIVSKTLRTLAPDEEIITQPWYNPVKGTTGPTQAQRAMFILKSRNAGSKEIEMAKDIDAIEERVSAFTRKFYDRASDSTHAVAQKKEILRLQNYLVALLSDLLDV